MYGGPAGHDLRRSAMNVLYARGGDTIDGGSGNNTIYAAARDLIGEAERRPRHGLRL